MPQYVPIRYGGDVIDLSKRFAFSTTVAASPSGSSETTIASLSIPSGVDTAATDGATYNLTITIGSGAAASTVSAVYFSAILF